VPDLREDLATMLDEAEWNWLMPHAAQDQIILVSGGLNLLDVGVAIASDDTDSVQHWIQEQLIYKPSPDQLSNWNADQERRFQALIVRPYVLVQELV